MRATTLPRYGMTPQSEPSRPKTSSAISVVWLCLTLAAIVAAFLTDFSKVSLVPVAVATGALLLVLPLHCLPPIALAAFAMLPIGFLSDVEQSFRLYVSPSFVVMTVWAIRSSGLARERRPEGLAQWVTIAAVIFAALTIPFSVSSVQSVAWVANIAVFVLFPLLLAGRAHSESLARLLTLTWSTLGVVLGCMALLEKMLSYHVLGDLIPYARLDIQVTWLTDRATTLLGHPLMNATFFAVATTIAGVRLLQRPSPRTAFVVTATTIGLFLTVSRSGVIATVGALALGLLITLIQGRVSIGAKLLGLGAVIVTSGVLALSPLLADRGVEGAASTAVRFKVVDLAIRLAEEDGYLGSGAGTSNGRAVMAGARFPIENSFLCLLISVGVIGLLLMVAAIAAIVFAALRQASIPEASGMLCFSIICGAWPVWDNRPVAWMIFTSLILMALTNAGIGKVIHEHRGKGEGPSHPGEPPVSLNVAARSWPTT